MNTFAVLLLAFPFFLAVNGRLIAYTSLASATANSNAGAATNPPITGIKPIAPVA